MVLLQRERNNEIVILFVLVAALLSSDGCWRSNNNHCVVLLAHAATTTTAATTFLSLRPTTQKRPPSVAAPSAALAEKLFTRSVPSTRGTISTTYGGAPPDCWSSCSLKMSATGSTDTSSVAGVGGIMKTLTTTMTRRMMMTSSSSSSSTTTPYSPSSRKRRTSSSSSSTTTTKQVSFSSSSSSSANYEVRSYQHDGYTITYKYVPASVGMEDESPWLLIHPVGIGLASWFYDPFLNVLNEGRKAHPAVYVVNLIGCGVRDGSDVWKQNDDDGKSGGGGGVLMNDLTKLPMSWVEACERLIKQEEIRLYNRRSKFRLQSLFGGQQNGKNNVKKGWTIIAQGGLAPIGIALANRNNNKNIVGRLLLTSPPSYKELIQPIPRDELKRNIDFLTSPIAGTIAFSILEQRKIIEFFSNLFLFDKPCNPEWLDNAMDEACIDVRPPVQVFNAGYCNIHNLLSSDDGSTNNHKNKFLDTTTTARRPAILEQPTLILEGGTDNRNRIGYCNEQTSIISNCRVKTLQHGKNVLPWEAPTDVYNALAEFCEL